MFFRWGNRLREVRSHAQGLPARVWQSWDSFSGLWDSTSYLCLCSAQPHMALGKFCFSAPWPPPSVGKEWSEAFNGSQGWGPVQEQSWELRLGQLLWASSGEDGVPLKAERGGRVWGGGGNECGKKLSGVLGTCLLLSTFSELL